MDEKCKPNLSAHDVIELMSVLEQVIPSGLWEARDSAVQILDAYLLEAFETNPKSLEDMTVLKYAAVASATIGSKLHSSSNYARPVSDLIYPTEIKSLI